MAKTLSKLQILLQANTANFKKQMRGAQSTTQKFAKNAKSAMQTAGKGMAAGIGIATAAIGGIAKQQLNAAKEIERFAQISGSAATQFQKDAYATKQYGIEMEQLADISKDTKEKIGDFLNTGGGGMQDFADAMGYSEEQARQFAESMKGLSGVEVLQEMTNRMEAAGVSTEQMSHALEGMASDTTNLLPLLTNNGEGFKNLGDQAQRAGAIMDDKTLAAAKKVNQDLGVMKAQWGGIKVAIFTAVIPALSAASTWFVNNKEQIGAVAGKIGEFASVVGSHLVSGFNAVQPALVTFGDTVKTTFNFVSEHQELFITLASGLGGAAAAFTAFGAAAGAVAKVKTAISVVKGIASAAALIASPMGLAVVAIGGLVAAGVYLYRNWDDVKAKAKAIWGNIKTSITNNIDGAKQSVINGADAIKDKFTNAFNALPGPVKTALSLIATTVKNQIATVKTVFSTGFAVIKGLINGDMQAVKSAIKNGMSKLAGIARNQLGAMVGAIKEISSQMTQAGRDLIQGLINGIKAKAVDAVNTAKNMAGRVASAVKNFFVIRSPSRLMAEYGQYISQGLAKGIKDKENEAVQAALNLAKSVSDSIYEVKKKIALFNNDSEVASFKYDVAHGKYDGLSDKLLDQYIAEMTKLEQMKADYDGQKKEKERLKAEADKMAADKKSAADEFYALDVNGPQTELERLNESYRKKIDIVDKFEQMHTDKKAQAEQARLRIEQQYNDSLKQLEQTKYQESLGSITSLFGSMIGETSSAYKLMFNIQKGYDFVSAQSASLKAIANAWGSAPFPANLANVAMTTLKTGIIPAAIQAIKPQGFKSGGYTGNYGTDVAVGPVHGQEFVAHAKATKKYRSELEAMNRGTYERIAGNTSINVNVTVNGSGQGSVESNHQTGKQLGDLITAKIISWAQHEQRPGGILSA